MPSKNQPEKFHLHIFLSVFLALVLIIVISFTTFKKAFSITQPTDKPTIITFPTLTITHSRDSWKTYKDPNNAFTVQYPANYTTSGNIAKDLESWETGKGLTISDFNNPAKPTIFIEAIYDGYGPFFPSGEIQINADQNPIIFSLEKTSPETYQDLVNQGYIEPESELFKSPIEVINDIPFQITISHHERGNTGLEEELLKILSTFKINKSLSLQLPQNYQWSTPEKSTQHAAYITDSDLGLFYEPMPLTGNLWTTTIASPTASWIPIEDEIRQTISNQLNETWSHQLKEGNRSIIGIDGTASNGSTQGFVNMENDLIQVIFWNIFETSDGDDCPFTSNTSKRTTSCPIEVSIFQSIPTKLEKIFSANKTP